MVVYSMCEQANQVFVPNLWILDTWKIACFSDVVVVLLMKYLASSRLIYEKYQCSSIHYCWCVVVNQYDVSMLQNIGCSCLLNITGK